MTVKISFGIWFTKALYWASGVKQSWKAQEFYCNTLPDAESTVFYPFKSKS